MGFQNGGVMHVGSTHSPGAVTAVFIALGSGTIVLLHVFFALTWNSLFKWVGVGWPWFLNSGATVVLTLTVLFVVALIAGLCVRVPQRTRLLAGLGMCGGANAAMVVVLFVVGPGNIWPMVIVMGSLLITPAVILGIAIASLIVFVKTRYVEA